jgi:hypothetical protein
MIPPFMILPSHSGVDRRPNDPGTSRKIIDGKIMSMNGQAQLATTGPGAASRQGDVAPVSQGEGTLIS